MKTIIRRLQKLEEKVANHEIGGPSCADILRERRRRRLEAMGLPYEEPSHDPKLYENGNRPTWADVLRSHRARRCCAEIEAQRAKEATPPAMKHSYGRQIATDMLGYRGAV
jgi:hypothetical protein